MATLPRVVLSLCVAVGLSGCARSSLAARGARYEAEVSSRFAHVIEKPLAGTQAATRQFLEEKGYAFEAEQEPAELLTAWKGTEGSGRSRYLVRFIAAGPRRTVVRIFRFTEEGSGRTVRSRDEALEGELAQRLAFRPAARAVSSAAQEEPPAVPVREEDFYLTRWREDFRCERQVRGLPELLAPGLVVLIGEQLGSREAPAVVGDLVCGAAGRELSVALGLSIPRTEQARIDRYLASAGAPADQDALLEGRFWHRPYQDGRSSRAVFDLIDRVRAMRAMGLGVSLVAYDTDEVRASERDALLAEVWLKRRAARPEEVLVVLAGNTHVSTVTGTPWDRDFTPMAHHLREVPSLRVLELGYAKGRRWGCDLDKQGKLVCGIVLAAPVARVADSAGRSPYLRLYPSPTEEGFQGLLFVGALTPSLPALDMPRKERQPPPSYLRPSTPPPRPRNL